MRKPKLVKKAPPPMLVESYSSQLDHQKKKPDFFMDRDTAILHEDLMEILE